MKIGKFVLGILFVLLVIEIIIISPKEVDTNLDKSNSDLSIENLDDDIQQIMRGAHLSESSLEGKEWELWSDEAKSMKDKPTWDLKVVRATFYGKDNVTFVVTGSSGEVNVVTKDMVVTGDVKVRSSNGYLFRTEKVKYVSKIKTMSSVSSVKIWGPKTNGEISLFITGNSFNALLNKGEISITGDVLTEKLIQDQKKLIIKSNQADLSGKSNQAHFSGSVVMDYSTMRISGPDATFQYGEKSGLLKSVLVSGGVRVTDSDKWATSQRVSVNFDDEKYIFKGKPRVVQNSDELTGEEIIFSDGGKTVEVLGAKARVEKSRLETEE